MTQPQFSEFQPCDDCVDPERLKVMMAAFDFVGGYRPDVDLVVDAAAMYVEVKDVKARVAEPVSPAEIAATDQKKASIIDTAVTATSAAAELDKIRGQLAKRLARVDCVAYCGGRILQCPKLGFANQAGIQSAKVMFTASDTFVQNRSAFDQQG